MSVSTVHVWCVCVVCIVRICLCVVCVFLVYVLCCTCAPLTCMCVHVHTVYESVNSFSRPGPCLCLLILLQVLQKYVIKKTKIKDIFPGRSAAAHAASRSL